MRPYIHTGLLLLVLALASCRTGSGETGPGEPAIVFDPDTEAIQVVLFHLAQRCESCMAVEQVTVSLLEEEFSEAYRSGEIRFVPLSYRSKNGQEASRFLKASGQTLYVVKGDSISNLTSPAFMYASTHPDYYREALRAALGKYLE